jgi:glycerophosphoryl diester phosphodiesterase
VTTPVLISSPTTAPAIVGSQMQVVAHRGASAVAPENTLSAVRTAVALGADGIEIDVRRTADGEFVVIHDPSPTRTTDLGRRRFARRAPRVADLTLAQLRRLDAGSWKGSSFRGERIPTLSEVLELVAATRAHLLVEVKRPVGHDRRDVLALVGLLRDSPLPPNRVTVQSFDAGVVSSLRPLLPTANIAVLVGSPPRDLAPLSRWADQISLHHQRADTRAVDAIRGWGMRCFVWTVNRPAAMARVLRLGVDGVITDHPETLLDLATRPTHPATMTTGTAVTRRGERHRAPGLLP